MRKPVNQNLIKQESLTGHGKAFLLLFIETVYFSRNLLDDLTKISRIEKDGLE